MLKQSDFISRQNGELLVDFVGHYESLQQDFDRVCEHLGISKRQLNRINVSKSARSTLDSLDATSIEIINDYFSQDFDMFGYSKR